MDSDVPHKTNHPTRAFHYYRIALVSFFFNLSINWLSAVILKFPRISGRYMWVMALADAKPEFRAKLLPSSRLRAGRLRFNRKFLFVQIGRPVLRSRPFENNAVIKFYFRLLVAASCDVFAI